jgi:glucose-1-phosphate cytidylyltransferase
MRENRMTVHYTKIEPWQVTLVDTGENTMTGGRIKRIQPYVGNETFCLTYGDGVSDVDIRALLAYHREQGVTVTLTAVQPPGRFGAFSLSEGQTLIESFKEKPKGDGAYINGGFFVVEPAAFDLIAGDETVWEREPLEQLAQRGQLAAYRHHGFWHPMDTLRDKNYLEGLWQSGQAPWKIWE